MIWACYFCSKDYFIIKGKGGESKGKVLARKEREESVRKFEYWVWSERDGYVLAVLVLYSHKKILYVEFFGAWFMAVKSRWNPVIDGWDRSFSSPLRSLVSFKQWVWAD